MEVCLACYENRLASVFENATELRFYQFDGQEIYPAGRLSLPSKDPMDRTSAILARGVKFLVCGAICRGSQRVLTGAGVKVACWRRGDVDDVVSALRDDALDDLAMPGCPGRACCRLSGAPGQGRRRGFGRGREALQGLDPRRAGQRFSIEGDEQ